MMHFLEWRLHIKKELKYKGRDEDARKEFMEKIDTLNPSDLVFYDEMGLIIIYVFCMVGLKLENVPMAMYMDFVARGKVL